MKANCWEVKSCGRCGSVSRSNVCPVCTETKLHGTHDGINGGRACWAVPHTKCDGRTQGDFGKELRICMECDFYRLVKAEENGAYQLSATLLSKMRK
ncbi:MAG: two-CW domain-containing protein [Thermodesulfovibrionales bacterium]